MVAHAQVVKRIRDAVTAMREEEDQGEIITLQAFDVLLAVAIQPGITSAEIMQRTRLAQTSVSRYVNKLGTDANPLKSGHKLIEAVPDPREPRRLVVYLTDKGKARMARIVGAFTGEHVTTFDAPTAKQALRGGWA